MIQSSGCQLPTNQQPNNHPHSLLHIHQVTISHVLSIIHFLMVCGWQRIRKRALIQSLVSQGKLNFYPPLAPGCRNSRVIRVQLTGWPKKGAIDDLEGKILYRIIKSYCNHSELATLQIMCAWAYIWHRRCSSSHNSLRGIAHSIHSPHILLSGSFAVSYSVLSFPNNIYRQLGVYATV